MPRSVFFKFYFNVYSFVREGIGEPCISLLSCLFLPPIARGILTFESQLPCLLSSLASADSSLHSVTGGVSSHYKNLWQQTGSSWATPAHSCLRIFALAVPSAATVFSQIAAWLHPLTSFKCWLKRHLSEHLLKYCNP